MAMGKLWEVLLVATRLGLTSFGGPIAHIGYFRDEYVVRRKWLSEERFGELVALCQFLPGPASSQLGIAIGMGRAGMGGGLVAWLGFTLPSAVALILFAYGVHAFGGQGGDWLRGLKVVAVAVVALALWGMGRTLAPDRPRIAIAVLATAVVVVTGGIAAQLAVIAGGAVLGLVLLRPPEVQAVAVAGRRKGTLVAAAALAAIQTSANATAARQRGTSQPPPGLRGATRASERAEARRSAIPKGVTVGPRSPMRRFFVLGQAVRLV